MSREEKFILTITAGSHLTVHSFMLVFPSIFLILQNEFSVGLGSLGFIATLSSVMFGLGAIPAGYFESKVGGRNLLLLYQGGTIVASIVIIFSNSLMMFVVGLSLLGISCSIYHPAGLTIISRRISNISKGMGIHGVAGSLGLGIGPLIVSIFTYMISWKAAYGFFAGVNIILAFLTFVCISPGKSAESQRKKKEQTKTNKSGLILYYSIGILMGITFSGFTTFLPIHFSEQTSDWMMLPILRGGLLTSIVLLSGIVGQLLGGYFGSRVDKSILIFIIILLNIPFLALIGMTQGFAMIICGIIFGIVHFSMQPVGNSLIAKITHSSHRGVGYGINFFFSFGAGGLGAGICGIIADQYGVAKIFPALSIFLLPAVGLSWLLKKYIYR